MRIPLLGGSYVARSVIANAQRSINYYPELNPKDAPAPLTLYQRPGLRYLVNDPANVAPVRCLYRASNGKGYCVIGQQVYSVSQDFVLTSIGMLNQLATVPCSMVDNGTTIVLADSTPTGYTIDMATNTFAPIVDPTGTFGGATRVDILDTFILWNEPGTIFFGSTLSNVVQFNALYFAGKAGYPDPLVALFVNRRQIVLLGALKSEIWYNAGNANFPFAEVPGAYIEHGCVAPFSACQQDIEIYWLGQDLQGQGIVFKLKGYEVTRISNHALEYAIQQMTSKGIIITDAIGYTYQQGGHVFYVLHFPSGNQTWVYDAAMQDPEISWHQEAWTDNNGALNRHRGNCAANLYGVNVVGDYQNGALYKMDPTYYQDDVVPATPSPISFIRSFPHLTQIQTPQGLIPADGHTITWSNVRVDLDVGSVPTSTQLNPALVMLNFSTDRGKSFQQQALQQTAGALGEYETNPKWGCICRSRDIVFEISHSINGPAALQGLWADAEWTNN